MFTFGNDRSKIAAWPLLCILSIPLSTVGFLWQQSCGADVIVMHAYMMREAFFDAENDPLSFFFGLAWQRWQQSCGVLAQEA